MIKLIDFSIFNCWFDARFVKRITNTILSNKKNEEFTISFDTFDNSSGCYRSWNQNRYENSLKTVFVQRDTRFHDIFLDFNKELFFLEIEKVEDNLQAKHFLFEILSALMSKLSRRFSKLSRFIWSGFFVTRLISLIWLSVKLEKIDNFRMIFHWIETFQNINITHKITESNKVSVPLHFHWFLVITQIAISTPTFKYPTNHQILS